VCELFYVYRLLNCLKINTYIHRDNDAAVQIDMTSTPPCIN